MTIPTQPVLIEVLEHAPSPTVSTRRASYPTGIPNSSRAFKNRGFPPPSVFIYNEVWLIDSLREGPSNFVQACCVCGRRFELRERRALCYGSLAKRPNFPQRRGSITQFSPTLRSLRCSLHSHRGHVPGAQYFSAQRSYHVTRDKHMDFTGAIRKLLRRPNHYRNTQNTGDWELLKAVLYDTNSKHDRRGMCADGTAIALRRSLSTINVSINLYHDP